VVQGGLKGLWWCLVGVRTAASTRHAATRQGRPHLEGQVGEVCHSRRGGQHVARQGVEVTITNRLFVFDGGGGGGGGRDEHVEVRVGAPGTMTWSPARNISVH